MGYVKVRSWAYTFLFSDNLSNYIIIIIIVIIIIIYSYKVVVALLLL
jgi:hypothetical protein